MSAALCVNEAIVLAAGRATRFWPLGQDRHKSMEAAGSGKPILHSTLTTLLSAGIERILLVHRPEDSALIEMIRGDPSLAHTVELIPHGKAEGQGEALLAAATRIWSSTVFLVGPEKVTADQLLGRLKDGGAGMPAALLLTKSISSAPSDYGIAVCRGARVLRVREKPGREQSPARGRRIVGAYLLHRSFFAALAHVQAQSPGHYTFEAALDLSASLNEVRHLQCDDLETPSLKYPWHLLDIHQFLLRRDVRRAIHPSARIHPTAVIEGDVRIEEGVEILAHAVIKGPCAIGRNAIIGDHSLIRGGCLIGPDSIVGAFTELKASIIGEGARTHGNCVLDSIIARGANIGAGTVTANRRLDGGPVRSTVGTDRIDALRTHLGTIIGPEASIGINVAIAPGVKIGTRAAIGMGSAVHHDVPDDTLLFFDQAHGELRQQHRPA